MRDRSVVGDKLVLCLRFKVAGIMALMQLAGGFAKDAVDHPPALHCRPFADRISPALHVLVLLHLQKLSRSIKPALDQTAIPRPNGDPRLRIRFNPDLSCREVRGFPAD